MDPLTLLGIGGKILGGILANNAEKRERAQSLNDVQQQFVRLREAAELAGFNPLSVLGTSSGIPEAGTPSASGAYMGSAIADSALMLADDLSRKQSMGTLSKVNRLESENAELSSRLTMATLRPKVGGVYSQRGVNGAPFGMASLAAGVVRPSPVVTGGALTPLQAVDPVDPRRQTQPLAIPDESGFAVVDNPVTGRFRIPMVAGEVPDVFQWPSIIGAWAFQKSYDAGKAFAPRAASFSAIHARRPPGWFSSPSTGSRSSKPSFPWSPQASASYGYNPRFGWDASR